MQLRRLVFSEAVWAFNLSFSREKIPLSLLFRSVVAGVDHVERRVVTYKQRRERVGGVTTASVFAQASGDPAISFASTRAGKKVPRLLEHLFSSTPLLR